jgi:hypothetical protein
MVALLPSPVLQFCDQNGVPLAGGTIATYVPGTTTPVTTWSESTGSFANTNPIVLDAAGECTIYASGIVRLVLKDASGNLQFDQPSNTLVSAAMAPVCIAPDIPTAQGLLGIQNNTAQLATLTTGLAAAVASVTAEVTRAEAAETALTTAWTAGVAAETTRAEAAEAALSARIPSSGTVKAGVAATSSSGTASVTFSPAFSSVPAVVCCLSGNATNMTIRLSSTSTTGFTVFIEDTDNHGGQASSFTWLAST